MKHIVLTPEEGASLFVVNLPSTVGATCLDPCTLTNYNRALDWISLIIGNHSGPTSHPGVAKICRRDLVSVECASTPQVVIKTPCSWVNDYPICIFRFDTILS